MAARGQSVVHALKRVYVMHNPYAFSGKESDASAIEFLDSLIREAQSNHITDIHIEPYAEHYRVRFRRDGLLQETSTLSNPLGNRITTRLKILAELNIAERRLPQDGRLRLGRNKVDIRMSTCPTLYGEKTVLRLLNVTSQHLNIHALGMTETQEKLFIKILSRPQGLILVTGPTGSGKTMTLYSAIHHLNTCEKNISTVEDPVEIELPGINQVNIHPKIGLDFATVLRAFLRQDPDVLMVGEIRDLETASIAAQAAQTGHLVLSTLHANSAREAIRRLQSLGLATHHLIHSLSLVMAQRLVRQLCAHCKQADPLTGHYLPQGCEQCHQGYHGRLGIFECLPITSHTAQAILSESDTDSEWPLLWENGLEKVKQGNTSLSELVKIIGHV